MRASSWSAIGDRARAVVSPRGADSDRDRRRVAEHERARQLGADRRLDRARAKRARPRVAGVDKRGAGDGVEEQRPRADAALRPRDRKSVLRVRERHAAAGERRVGEAAQQARRAAVERDRAAIGRAAAEEEGAADGGIAGRRSAGRAERDHVVRPRARQVRARVGRQRRGVGEGRERAADDLGRRADKHAVLAADRIPVGLRRRRLPCAAHRRQVPRQRRRGERVLVRRTEAGEQRGV